MVQALCNMDLSSDYNLTNKNFILFAARNYSSASCTTIEEFENDVKRFQYLKKLFSKYKSGKDLKVRLILNHIIILQNIFGPQNTTKMLFLKLDGHYKELVPFLRKVNLLPDIIKYVNGTIINTRDIEMEPLVTALIERHFNDCEDDEQNDD